MTIREKADALLKTTALMRVMQPCGAAVVGSYAMDLMSWNDLDIYVDTAEMSVEKWCGLVAKAVCAVQPVRIDGFQDVPAGKFFLGMETMITGERWNIDIWGKTAGEIAEAQRRNDDMKLAFEQTPGAKEAMLQIKQGLIERKMYGFDKGRKHFHSPEIYDAVLQKGVRTLKEFLDE